MWLAWPRLAAPALQMGCLGLFAWLGLGLSTSAANAETFAQSCTRQSAPILRTAGLSLLRDGQPSFLVLVSYFDVMRASEAALDRDFAFLKSKGIDGIRVFPLWVYGTQQPDATLLDASGRIRAERAPAEGEGFVISEVVLADSKPVPTQPQPQPPLPRMAAYMSLFNSDVLVPFMMKSVYKNGLKKLKK